MTKYEYNKKYVDKYLAQFERIDLKVPKGKRQVIKDYAARHGESVNEFINRLINKEIGHSESEG